ncbi:MAG: hypothetical protein VX092_03415, partial [SAR324 cluster bacterium]|nr:hypothetical protein [SAR324 cluster bacterium]
EIFEGLSGTKILRDSNRTILGVMFQRNFRPLGMLLRFSGNALRWGILIRFFSKSDVFISEGKI